MKYCTQCGFQNADENKYCRGCGKAFFTPQPKIEQPQPKPESKSEPKLPEGTVVTPLAKGAVKEMLNKPVFLVAVILFSVVAFFKALKEVVGLGLVIPEFLDSVSGVENMTLGGAVPSFEITGMTALVPYVLLCIGLWILFAQAKKESVDSIKGNGFLLIKIGMITKLVLMTTSIGFTAIAAIFMQLKGLFTNFSADGQGVDFSLLIQGNALLIALAVVVFYYTVVLRLMDCVKFTAVAGITNFKVPKFVIAGSYIYGAVSIVFSVLSFSDYGVIGLLGAVAEAAFLVAVAICISQYKKELLILQAYLKQLETAEEQ